MNPRKIGPVKTQRVTPPRGIIYGGVGIGKSSLVAQASSVIFIQTEDGLNRIETESMSDGALTSLSEVYEAFEWLYDNPTKYKIICIDTLDGLETLVQNQVKQDKKIDSLSDLQNAKGWDFLNKEWANVVKWLDTLYQMGMGIIMIAHETIRKVNNPYGDDFDRYDIAMREKNGEPLKGWCDFIGYYHLDVETTARKEGFSKIVKARGGDRVLSFQSKLGHVAKNRHNIEDDIPCPSAKEGWANMMAAMYPKQTTKEVKK